MYYILMHHILHSLQLSFYTSKQKGVKSFGANTQSQLGGTQSLRKAEIVEINMLRLKQFN